MQDFEIKELIRRDPKYTIGALLSLCPLGAHHKDYKILNDITAFYLDRGYLSNNQIALIRPMLIKYIHLLDGKLEPVASNEFKLSNVVGPKVSHIEKKVEQIGKDRIKLTFPFDTNILNQIKKINGRAYDPQDKSWTIPLTITNLDRIVELGFPLCASLKKWLKDMDQEIEQVVVDDLDDILRDFQRKAVSFIESRHGRALIADDQGLGKTLEAIAWMHYHREDDVYPTLIICPAAVKLNWKKEIQKFTRRGNEVQILSGRTAYRPEKEILIINYDILAEWKNYIIKSMKPKLIIADEIHKCKDSSAQRSKALKVIGEDSKYFIGLTGTPIMNRPAELFHPISIIKPTLFPDEKAYLFRYCGPKKDEYGMSFKGATNTLELNHILTRECMIRRKKEDVLKELPDKTRDLIPLEIDNRSDYEEAFTDLIKYIRKFDVQKAERMSKVKALAKTNFLKQLAGKGKVKQAIGWISDFIENEKLVLFIHHRETADRIMEKFSKNAVRYVGGMSQKQRERAEQDFWKKDEIRLFVGNLQAAGEGINLQVASNLAFLEFPWSPSALRQAEDRVHRIGQKNAVNIYNLIAEDTIEEHIVQILDRKAKVVSEIIDGDDSPNNAIFNELIAYLTHKHKGGRKRRDNVGDTVAMNHVMN